MNPANAYGEGKRAAELLCTLYHKAHPELETKIARCFAFVGPYLPLDTHFAIGNFIRDALNGGPIRVNGDGTPYRSYLYASDLAIWLWTILIKGKECQPYNVGSKEDLPVADLAHKVANIHGNIKVNIALSTKQGISVSRYVPSVFLAEKELKLKAEIGLDEAIRRSINYASNQKLFSKTIRG
jgi:dTDP-glucose 4,6-dehydratase